MYHHLILEIQSNPALLTGAFNTEEFSRPRRKVHTFSPNYFASYRHDSNSENFLRSDRNNSQKIHLINHCQLLANSKRCKVFKCTATDSYKSSISLIKKVYILFSNRYFYPFQVSFDTVLIFLPKE